MTDFCMAFGVVMMAVVYWWWFCWIWTFLSLFFFSKCFYLFSLKYCIELSCFFRFLGEILQNFNFEAMRIEYENGEMCVYVWISHGNYMEMPWISHRNEWRRHIIPIVHTAKPLCILLYHWAIYNIGLMTILWSEYFSIS